MFLCCLVKYCDLEFEGLKFKYLSNQNQNHETSSDRDIMKITKPLSRTVGLNIIRQGDIGDNMLQRKTNRTFCLKPEALLS